MIFSDFGQPIYSEDELADLLYTDPSINLSDFHSDYAATYNEIVRDTFSEFAELHHPFTGNINQFDSTNQSNWYMPDEYLNMDIHLYVMGLCKPSEVERCQMELVKFEERNMYQLLKYLVYFVNTMRANGCVWGVGRGSSVSSHVLFLIGVHRINSIEHQLDITEFLKD